MHFDITRANPADEEEMKRLEAWVSLTEQEPVTLPRHAGINVWVAWKEGEIAAVFTTHNTPVLSMFFERTAPAMQTIRCFDTIRAIMHAMGAKPLVFVDHKSPLRDISGKRMTQLEGWDVYRMT